MSTGSPSSEAPAATPSPLHVKCQSPELYILNPREVHAHSLFPAPSRSHLTMPLLSSAKFQKKLLPSLTFESSTVGVVGDKANIVDTQLRSSVTATTIVEVYCETKEVYNFSSGGWGGDLERLKAALREFGNLSGANMMALMVGKEFKVIKYEVGGGFAKHTDSGHKIQLTPTWAKPGRKLNETQLSYYKRRGLKEPELNQGLEMSEDDAQDARSIGTVLLFPPTDDPAMAYTGGELILHEGDGEPTVLDFGAPGRKEWEMVMFPHQIPHESKPVLTGTKHIVKGTLYYINNLDYLERRIIPAADAQNPIPVEVDKRRIATCENQLTTINDQISALKRKAEETKEKIKFLKTNHATDPTLAANLTKLLNDKRRKDKPIYIPLAHTYTSPTPTEFLGRDRVTYNTALSIFPQSIRIAPIHLVSSQAADVQHRESEQEYVDKYIDKDQKDMKIIAGYVVDDDNEFDARSTYNDMTIVDEEGNVVGSDFDVVGEVVAEGQKYNDEYYEDQTVYLSYMIVVNTDNISDCARENWESYGHFYMDKANKIPRPLEMPY